MSCRICARLRDWLGIAPERSCEALWDSQWDRSNAWERANANNAELWSQEPESNLKLLEGAHAIASSDPAAAFRMFAEAADAGSAVAMESVAWHYHTGTFVAADFGRAADLYCAAISGGSWSATIGYARLLFEHGHFDACDKVLKDGVELGFVPAYFWLAQFSYERSPDRATCRRIRPLLEHAAERGHPAARLVLAQMMARGRFGLLSIPRGIRLYFRAIPSPPPSDDRRTDDRLDRSLRAAAQH